MYERPFRGFGNYQRFGLGEKCLQFRGQARMIAASSYDPCSGIGKKPQAALRNRFQPVPFGMAERIVAATQESIMIIAEPFEECDALAQQFLLYRGRMGLESRDRLIELLEHPSPIPHREADLREYIADAF